MNRSFQERRIRFIAFVVLLGIISFLISCTSNNRTLYDTVQKGRQSEDSNVVEKLQGEDNQEIKPNKAEAQGESSGWRTDEIFDSEKYIGKLTVRFFHTGVPVEGSAEGDLILVTSPDGATMLIDAGLPECGPKLVQYLEMLEVRKLDYAVGTHMHIDHIGGYPDVINYIDIDKAIVPNFIDYDTSIAKKFLASLENKKIPIEIVKKGDTFKLGEYVDIEVLAPEWDIVIPEGTIPEKSAGFVNNHSLVLKMTYGENSFLFTADIYWEREDILVAEQKEKLKVDVLKVPHHGSHTSSSINFVNTVEPEIAIITSLSPNKDVYNRYKRVGSNIFITGLDGNLLIVSDGENIEVIQEHERSIKGYYE